jgi:hypothetical protein
MAAVNQSEHDFVVYSSEGKEVYRGRHPENWAEMNKRRSGKYYIIPLKAVNEMRKDLDGRIYPSSLRQHAIKYIQYGKVMEPRPRV